MKTSYLGLKPQIKLLDKKPARFENTDLFCIQVWNLKKRWLMRIDSLSTGGSLY